VSRVIRARTDIVSISASRCFVCLCPMPLLLLLYLDLLTCMRLRLLIGWLAALGTVWADQVRLERDVTALFNDTQGRHTNNWAVLVDTSRYWFNYRVCTLSIPTRSLVCPLRSMRLCNQYR